MSFQKQVFAAVIAMLFILVPFGSAQARVSIKETTKYYKIRAKNAKGVYRQIGRRGMKSHGVKNAVAVTLIKMSVDRVKTLTRGRRCSITSARVQLKLVYTYPRWSNAKRGSRNTRKKWKVYFKHIVRHEKKHGAIAKEMAREFNRSVRKLKGRTYRQCSGMPQKVRRLFKKVNKKYDRQQRAFDKREHRRNSQIMKLARSFAFSK